MPSPLLEIHSALRQGDITAAETLLSAVPEEEAEEASYVACRILWKMFAGEIAEAHSMLAALDATTRTVADIRTAQAAVLMISRATDEATSILDEVLREQPRHEMGRYLSALWRAQSGELQSAHDLLLSLCSDFPDHALARLQLGQVLMAAGDVARAGTLFEAAIDTAPHLEQAWERFASLLSLGNQPQEALLVAKQGLNHHPQSRTLLEIFARSALTVGATDLALDSTRLVLATAGDDPVAHANYAVALTACGHRAEALTVVQEAKERFPNDVALRQLENEIASSRSAAPADTLT